MFLYHAGFFKVTVGDQQLELLYGQLLQFQLYVANSPADVYKVWDWSPCEANDNIFMISETTKLYVRECVEASDFLSYLCMYG